MPNDIDLRIALALALRDEFGPNFDLGSVQYADIEDTVGAALVALGVTSYDADGFGEKLDRWTTFFDGRTTWSAERTV